MAQSATERDREVDRSPLVWAGCYYGGMEASPASRSIALLRSPSHDGVGVFRIVSGESCFHYTFHEIPCSIGGRGFAVHRMGLGEVYHVRVGRREDCSCECLGFLRHGRCKHILGLLALKRKGQLPRQLRQFP